MAKKVGKGSFLFELFFDRNRCPDGFSSLLEVILGSLVPFWTHLGLLKEDLVVCSGR